MLFSRERNHECVHAIKKARAPSLVILTSFHLLIIIQLSFHLFKTIHCPRILIIHNFLVSPHKDQLKMLRIEVSQTSTKKVRGANFTIQEDQVFINAWLNTSIALIQGNEQKSATFWERITKYYY